jgi:hypothetical protein
VRLPVSDGSSGGLAAFDGKFVVDETGFQLVDESSAALEEAFESFLQLLDYVRDVGHHAERWSELWATESASGRSLSDLLFLNSNIDTDLRRLLAGRLDKLPEWDRYGLSPNADLTCGDVEVTLAPSVGLAATAVTNGRNVGCLTTTQGLGPGLVRVIPSGAQGANVYFLRAPSEGPGFWRYGVEVEDSTVADVEAIAPLAFPRLRFSTRTWGHVDKFEGAFRDLRPTLIGHLSGLNDHAPEIWREAKVASEISALLAGRARITCSLESPNTHKNKGAMSQRTIDFEGKSVVCEWHTKLEPHRNRIHFAVEEDQVFVGLFVAHLDT